MPQYMGFVQKHAKQGNNLKTVLEEAFSVNVIYDVFNVLIMAKPVANSKSKEEIC
jgi:hypothetical protein